MAIKYLKQYENGTVERADNKPSYGLYEATKPNDDRDVFIGGKWYPASNGGELVTNGTFDSDTSGWTAYNASLNNSNNVLNIVDAGGESNASQLLTTVVGIMYTINFQVVSGGTYGVTVGVLDSPPTALSDGALSTSLQNGVYTYSFTATSTTSYIYFGGASSDTQKIDNISVYAVEPTISTTPYTDQFTYLSENGKLLAVEVANGKPVDIHLEDTESNEVAPSLYLPSIQAENIVAKEYSGKNVATAWCNFDGTTTPPTIRDSYNVKSVIRTATGEYTLYFEQDMDNNDYSAVGTVGAVGRNISLNDPEMEAGLFAFQIRKASDLALENRQAYIQVFGGKN